MTTLAAGPGSVRAPLVGVAVAFALLVAGESRRSTRSLVIATRPGHEPSQIFYRPEGGDRWTLVDSYYIAELADRYTLVAVCPPISSRDQIHVFHLAARDTSLLDPGCRGDIGRPIKTPVRFTDPARQAWVSDQHAGVAVDGNGRVVRWDDEVELYPSTHDWIGWSSDHRVTLVHDVPASTATVKIDMAGSRPVNHINVRARGAESTSVTFISRNGTVFRGLGRRTAAPDHQTFDVVPWDLREPGDRDIITMERSYGDGHQTVHHATQRGTSFDLAFAGYTPFGFVDARGRVTWSGADDVAAVRVDVDDEFAYWDIHVSGGWLAGTAVYEPADPRGIPGWRWGRPDATRNAWIEWSWTSNPASIPLDARPPADVTYFRTSLPLVHRP